MPRRITGIEAGNAPDGRGDFFAIDRRAWAVAFDKTGLHGALAYLILARGSLGDMRTTSWSAEAINLRTKLNWRQAKEAINRLIDAGLIRRDKDGSKPRYYIMPVPEQAAAETPPQWIWLPNALIDGVDGETSPIELVRQSGRPAALRLLIELYGAQELAEVGGVHWRQLRRKYSHEKLGQQGLHTVWGFRSSVQETWADVPFVKSHLTGKMVKDDSGNKRDEGLTIFWDALKILEITGLVYFVPHVIEHDHDKGERGAVVHPFGWPSGEPAEKELAIAANEAGKAMVAGWKLAELNRKGELDGMLFVPARQHLLDVQMVGLARLKYRTRSSATAVWAARMAEWERLASETWQKGRTLERKSPLADINDTSTSNQRGINGRSTSR